MQLNIASINLSIYFIYFSTYYSNKNYYLNIYIYLQTKGVTNITTSFLFFFFFIISKTFKQGNKGGRNKWKFQQSQLKRNEATAGQFARKRRIGRASTWPVRVSGLIFHAAPCPSSRSGCVHVVSSHLSQIHFNFTRRNVAFPFSFSQPFASSPCVPTTPHSPLCHFYCFLKRARLSVPFLLSLSLSFCPTTSKLGSKNTAIPLSPLTRRTIRIARSLVSTHPALLFHPFCSLFAPSSHVSSSTSFLWFRC